jgi:hypothetical protein
VRTGQILALLGPSGAGKTTMLDILARRAKGGTVKGDLLMNGHPVNPGVFRRVSAYVQQEDIMHSYLTVRETVAFNAKLRLPPEFTDAMIDDKVTNILKLLVLKNVYADGNTTNGRCIWSVNGFGGYGTERLTQFRYENLVQVNVTAASESLPTIRAAVASPTLRFGTLYNLTNGSAQNITSFSDLIQGEEYTLYATDANSTLVDGANLVLTGSANWNPSATDVFKGFCLDGTKMIQTVKNDNS